MRLGDSDKIKFSDLDFVVINFEIYACSFLNLSDIDFFVFIEKTVCQIVCDREI